MGLLPHRQGTGVHDAGMHWRIDQMIKVFGDVTVVDSAVDTPQTSGTVPHLQQMLRPTLALHQHHDGGEAERGKGWVEKIGADGELPRLQGITQGEFLIAYTVHLPTGGRAPGW